ncbi:SpoIIE family protein phosphatase [Parvicella tangerina]|uniref:SpoIIE family protein phosphatase n=1 Tax=Parvicella tangerina TaxID=2829795 RepID=UPI00215CA4F3|nr:SpoIIE family protein phosphatase [Parvicella tangerina]
MSKQAQITAPHITNYTTKDYGALKSPEVWSIAQGDDGLMYFGFVNEIGVFDGETWSFIALENTLNITSLDYHEGRLYFGAYGKFGYLEANEHGDLSTTLLSKDAGVFSNVWRIHYLNGVTYFQSYEGIFAYNGEKVESILPKTSFHLSFTCNNKLFVRQRDVGLMQVNGLTPELINSHPILKEYGLFEAFQVSDKDAFIVTMEKGLQKTSADLSGSLSYLCPDTCSVFTNKGIIGGVQLSNNLFALYSANHGCYFTNAFGDYQGRIGQFSGLASDEVKDAYVDDNGKLWLATGNGIAKVEVMEPLEFIGEDFGVNGNVQCLAKFKGQKFVGTSLGLVKEDTNRTLFFKETSLKQQVWDIQVVEDKLFIATSGGLFETMDGENYTIKYGGNFNQIYYDELNKFLIVAGEDQTMILDGFANWGVFSYTAFSGGNKTNVVYDQKNNCYWVGSSTGGILKITFDGFEFNYKIYGLQEGEGLRVGEPIIPFDIEGSALFGTPLDLLEFTNEQEAMEELKSSGAWNDTMINYPEFYPGSFFEAEKYFLGSSKNYQYYLEAGVGILIGVVDNKVGVFNEGEFDVSKFNTLKLGRINFLQIEEEGMYVGGSGGMALVDLLTLLNADSVVRNVHVNIREITYNDSLSVGTYGDFKHLQVPYNRNNINFKIASTTIHNSTKPLYSWRLVGDNDSWSEWSSNTVLSFKNLHEGKYKLEVKAKDAFGNVSEVKSFSFEVETPWYRTTWAYLLYLLLFIVVVYLAIVLGRARLKAQNQRLEETVQERTEEIRHKNAELEHSYMEIAEQKQEITDSINYAQRIQQAILPLEENIEQYISEYFVLFQPKDIVSGDFYWFANTNGRSIFVCADCTGHGVPGAFMSMIGSDKLNQAILEGQLTNPADILSFVNVGIKRALRQNEEAENASRDGMDATIVSIDKQNMNLQVSGAHNSLVLIRDGELTEFKTTKVAVAGFTPEDQVYDLTEYDLKEGDCLYMTTDGYVDQFGGPKGKKLKSAVYKRMLLEIWQKPMDEQREYLSNYMKEWMGDHEQIDDICVVGIKV